jgi:hypothetical protein
MENLTTALTEESKHLAAIEAQEYNLFALLKPKVSRDGNQWCVLYGENLQEGVSGFGDTIYLAILDFNKSFHQPIPNQ